MLMLPPSTGVKPMKNLSFFVSAFALCASTSYAAINCGTLPSCSDLGYTDKVAECPSSSEVLKCPFDTAYGKCTKGPSVGDLKYSLNTANHNGWILCDGQGIDKTKYAELFKIIGTDYGSSGNNFRVPDYRGFFLRAYGTNDKNNALSSFWGSANSSLTTPQKEQLPNITGEAEGFLEGYTPTKQYLDTDQTKIVSGAFSTSETHTHVGNHGSWDQDNYKLIFSAANTPGTGKGVYTDEGHVIPANYAANIFIYAGK